jgi:hypothetical protein
MITFAGDKRRVDNLNDLLLELVTPSILVHLLRNGVMPAYEFMRYIAFRLHYQEAKIRTIDDWVKALAPVPSAKTRMRAGVYKGFGSKCLGTGSCGIVFEKGQRSRVIVKSEDQPDIVLLETEIQKGSDFRNHGRAIFWHEGYISDIALLFPELEGCIIVWRFICKYMDLK